MTCVTHQVDRMFSHSAFRVAAARNRMVRPLQLRCKSTNKEYVKDDFPYAKITADQFARWSDELSESGNLPSRALFAGHLPLMPMSRNPAVTHRGSQDIRDVMFVHIWQPRTMMFGDTGLRTVPHQVAMDLGPFDIAESLKAKPEQKSKPTSPPIAAEPLPSHLAKTLSLLGAIVGKPHEGNGGLVHIPIVNGQPVVEVEEDNVPTVTATSVRRKRKLKMNRHKYRKRLKEQRTQRRRLGK